MKKEKRSPEDKAQERTEGASLAEQCAKLDPAEEQALAEEGLLEELDRWPQY